MDLVNYKLQITASYLKEFIKDKANQLDWDADALFTALKGLGERDLLGFRCQFSAQDYGCFQEMLARYSGALAFLQTQHQSASAMIFNSENLALKNQYLVDVSRGNHLLGVGFSHLRRTGEPPLKAIAYDNGYLFDGSIPWVSGWGMFNQFIAAALLPDGRSIFALLPLEKQQQKTGGSLIFSSPIKLASMSSTNTVSATVNQWFVSPEKIVFIKPAFWIQQNDQINVLQPSYLALGCARAGIDIIENTAQTKSLEFIKNSAESLKAELNECRRKIYQNDTHNALKLRAWAIDLAVRCATCAVVVSSGAANTSNHAAQRVYREALVFTVSGQTNAVMEATLGRFIRFGEWGKKDSD